MDEDPSYSLLLWKEDTLDPLEDKLVRAILSRMCADGSPLVVDVGCNFGCAARAERPAGLPGSLQGCGRLSSLTIFHVLVSSPYWYKAACGRHSRGAPGRWYTLLALAHGCRVVAIDAGADHLASLNMSLALNGWLDRARLYHGVASAEREVSFNGWHAETASAEQAHGYSERDLNGRGKSYASQTPLVLDDIVDEVGHQVVLAGRACGREVLNPKPICCAPGGRLPQGGRRVARAQRVPLRAAAPGAAAGQIPAVRVDIPHRRQVPLRGLRRRRAGAAVRVGLPLLLC